MDIVAYALGYQEIWTSRLVKDALAKSFEVYRDSVGRIGPRGNKAFWAEYSLELDDIKTQEEIDENTRSRKRGRRTGLEIQRADMILLGWKDENGVHQPAWLIHPDLVAYDWARKCLVAWVMCKHHGVTEKALCERNRWPLSSFKRHRDFAAGRIAHRLNLMGIEVW
ncbi:MAG: hypothetical protein ACOH2N_00485 [Devosia sp.]